MKYLLLISILLSGCESMDERRMRQANEQDPECFNGYIVSTFDYKVSGVCHSVFVDKTGIEGFGCFAVGQNSNEVLVQSMVLREGHVLSTKCFNIKEW